MDYKQKNIKIGDMLLPEIKYKDDIYYPLTYVFEKILLKQKQNTTLLKNRGYAEYLAKFKVNFDFCNGGLHNTNCISKEGLIRLLNLSYIGGMSVEQKQGMNFLLDYFDKELISKQPRYENNIEYKLSSEYDEFEKDCIDATLKAFGGLEWQLCNKCNKYYPLHGNFFRYNRRDGLGNVCRNCLNTDSRHMIAHPDTTLTKIYREHGDEVYGYYKKHETINIYNHYIENNLNLFPKILLNKEDALIIIQHLYDNKKINKDNITMVLLRNIHGLKTIGTCLTMEEAYEHLYGSHPRSYPWHYPNYKLKNLTSEEAKTILNNYLIENDLEKIDPYELNYEDILKSQG